LGNVVAGEFRRHLLQPCNALRLPVHLALYQPDIAQNTGAILRLGACLGVTVHIVGPAGFDLSDRALRRVGMDYLDHAAVVRHVDWAAFAVWRAGAGARLILMTTRAATPYTSFRFRPDDVLLFGRESAGVPDTVHDAADHRLLIPMAAGLRSLNLATAAAMVLGEGLRQTNGFP
jgi:tRNA (cytidine/uridine-2'-O-)-methyltransferase